MKTRLIALACLATLPAAPALAAGIVEVNFIQADQFSDIGRNVVDRQRNLDRIAEHLKRFAGRLPDGQTLKVDLTDIDLAGEVRFTRHLDEIRVLKGSVDWPRMNLRWTLSAADGRTLQSGSEQLKDMAYLVRTPRGANYDVLAYDFRLLDEWFAARFGAAAPD